MLGQLGEGGSHGTALDCLVKGIGTQEAHWHAVRSRIPLHLHIPTELHSADFALIIS